MAGGHAEHPGPRGAGDVLRMLRTGTATEHEAVERSLDLLDPAVDRPRLVAVLGRLHGFWLAAEDGLDAWAAAHPADAREIEDAAAEVLPPARAKPGCRPPLSGSVVFPGGAS